MPTLLHDHAALCSLTRRLMGVWAVSAFGLLWVVLQGTFLYQFLFGFPLTVLSVYNQG